MPLGALVRDAFARRSKPIGWAETPGRASAQPAGTARAWGTLEGKGLWLVWPLLALRIALGRATHEPGLAGQGQDRA
jgi:hypothetical protein